MTTLQAIIIAIIEGLTEYLPVSSTAHMVFTGDLLNVDLDANFVKLFTYCIQFGSILAVVTLYWRKFFDFAKFNFYLKLCLAVLPALVLGKLFSEKIDLLLESPKILAAVLIIGGVILLFVDQLFTNPTVTKEQDISIKQAVTIGFWQCLAMIPGTSRSAASIVGGMQQGINRQTAAEFSFFLAVPTMLAVTIYALGVKTWNENGIATKGYQLLANSIDKLWVFMLGFIIAYLVSIVAIKFLIHILSKYGFKVWGIYRIIVGSLLLIYYCFF